MYNDANIYQYITQTKQSWFVYSKNIISKICRIFFSGTKNADFIEISTGLAVMIIVFFIHIVFITFIIKFVFFFTNNKIFFKNNFSKAILLIEIFIFLSLLILYILTVFFTKSNFWFWNFAAIFTILTIIFVFLILNEKERNDIGYIIILWTILVAVFVVSVLYFISYYYVPNFNKPLQLYNLEYLKKDCLTYTEKDILNRKFYLDKKKRGVAEASFFSYMYYTNELSTNINFITENYIFNMK